MDIISVIEAARELHEPDEAAPLEYTRGQADLIGDLFGFDSDDKEPIADVIRRKISVVRFAVTMLQNPWSRNPSERQLATTDEMIRWLEALAAAPPPAGQAQYPCQGTSQAWGQGAGTMPVCPVCHLGPGGMAAPMPSGAPARGWAGTVPAHRDGRIPR